jgi:hypothetical protein
MAAPNAITNPDAPAQRQVPLELVPPSPPNPDREPEQLPLIRMLEIVRERVESIHAGQRSIGDELREIRQSLPQQRRPFSARTQALHVNVTLKRRNGLCPCCQVTRVCDESGRLPGAEFDHFFNRAQNRATQGWLVCAKCNAQLIDSEFKAAARSAFESYQQALKPFLGGRQISLGY